MGSFTYAQVSGLQTPKEPMLPHRSLGNTHKHSKASTHCSLLHFLLQLQLLLLLLQLLHLMGPAEEKYLHVLLAASQTHTSFPLSQIPTPPPPAASLLSFYANSCCAG